MEEIFDEVANICGMAICPSRQQDKWCGLVPRIGNFLWRVRGHLMNDAKILLNSFRS
jgi:hypothetical protein